MEFIEREWFKLGLLIILLLATTFTFVYFRTRVTPVVGQKQESFERVAKVADAPASTTLTISQAISYIYKTYGYTPIVGADEHHVWFIRPNEKDGCSFLNYIDLVSRQLINSELADCPEIKLSDSYPFYIDSYGSALSQGKKLEVTNLLTLEKKTVHNITNDQETCLKSYKDDGVFGSTELGLSYTSGYLTIPTYTISKINADGTFDNGAPLRKDTVDLFKLFGMERAQQVQ